MRKLQLVTTTATYANKAKAVLRNAGIQSEVRRAQGGTAAGCLYGVVIAEENIDRARKILTDENVRILSEKEVPQ